MARFTIRHAVKLVLWHGRMIYKTCTNMCYFVMHRGLIIATMQFFFTCMFFFVDMPIFNGFLTFGYSTIFTSLPVIALIMDEDLSFRTVKEYPQLYKEVQPGRQLSAKVFCLMIMKSVFQGAVIMYLSVILFPSSTLEIVTITFSALILTELLNTVTMVFSFDVGLAFFLCSILYLVSLNILIFPYFNDAQRVHQHGYYHQGVRRQDLNHRGSFLGDHFHA